MKRLTFGATGDDWRAGSAERYEVLVGGKPAANALGVPERFDQLTDVGGFIPATAILFAATETAFGVVLLDVDVAGATRLEFYDTSERLIHTQAVPVATAVSKGMSFVAVQLSQPVARVRIVGTSGHDLIGELL